MQMLNIIKGPLIIKEWTYYELGPSSDVQSCHRIVDTSPKYEVRILTVALMSNDKALI